MPNYDPAMLAYMLRQAPQLNAMAGQGQMTDAERQYLNLANTGMAMQGQVPMSREDVFRQNMQQMQGLGQGMGQITDAERALMLNQGK